MLNRLRQFIAPAARRPFRLFQIESSLDCSLECVMCPWLELRQSGAMMSWDTFEKIAANFHQAESVDLTGGGEPLKNPLLPDMIAAARTAGCEVGFSSNATRLTPQIAERLVALELDWISFSVDAASAELYERIRQGARFAQITANIAMLRDLKRRLGVEKPRMLAVFVMMTGAQENYPELPAFVELAHSLGIEQVIAKNLDVILKDGDDDRRVFSHAGEVLEGVQAAISAAQAKAAELGVGLRLYSLQPQEIPMCEHTPTRSLFFNWEGQVSPCITLSYAADRVYNGQRVHVPCQRYGSIAAEPLDAIWNRPDYAAFRRQFDARVKAEQKAGMDLLLGGGETMEMTPAPEGCRTCYYLYGV